MIGFGISHFQGCIRTHRLPPIIRLRRYTIFKIPRQSCTAEFKREVVTLQSPGSRIVASAGSVNDGAALSREAAGDDASILFF